MTGLARLAAWLARLRNGYIELPGGYTSLVFPGTITN